MTRPAWRASAYALAEVALAFAIMRVAFRAFKRFTEWGQTETANGMNFSPGVAMILVAVVFMALGRRRPEAYALTARPLLPGINAAILCLLLLAACGGVALACGAPFERPPASLAGALGPVGVNLAATLLLLGLLWRFGRVIERTPGVIGLLLLVAVALSPIAMALAQQRTIGREALTVVWVLGGAGVGEEVFFRGFVQSRLNESFGRPWRLFGVDFGPGLLVASALFGLVHVLNSADYFVGVWRFAWWHGLATASTLFYGFLREKYGSVLAPAIVHGFGDLLIRLPHLLRG